MEPWKQEVIARSLKVAQRENKRRERAELIGCLSGWEPYLRRRGAGAAANVEPVLIGGWD